MVEVFTRTRSGEVITGRTQRQPGFASDAVQNCIDRAREAPGSREANESTGVGGCQSGGACGNSHRFAKYRPRIGGVRMS